MRQDKSVMFNLNRIFILLVSLKICQNPIDSRKVYLNALRSYCNKEDIFAKTLKYSKLALVSRFQMNLKHFRNYPNLHMSIWVKKQDINFPSFVINMNRFEKQFSIVFPHLPYVSIYSFQLCFPFHDPLFTHNYLDTSTGKLNCFIFHGYLVLLFLFTVQQLCSSFIKPFNKELHLASLIFSVERKKKAMCFLI